MGEHEENWLHHQLTPFFVLLVLMLGVSWFVGWGLVFIQVSNCTKKLAAQLGAPTLPPKKGGPFLNPISAGQTIPNVKAFF